MIPCDDKCQTDIPQKRRFKTFSFKGNYDLFSTPAKRTLERYYTTIHRTILTTRLRNK